MFEYNYIKALHIIFVVNWFAGLFYMPRLFIYTTEANEKPEPERSILIRQFQIMQRKLWHIITWPSCIITLILGTILLLQSGFITQPWMHIKLTFVLLLLLYHYSLHRIFKQQQQIIFRYTSTQLRIWNEVATIFLFAIVFVVVIKKKLSLFYGIISLIILVILLMLGIKLYKLLRKDE
ncbi:MAG: CopD family protein [Bacteroidetes bacterium]|nr:CopD family protein [Bacteroidota bacterium]